MVTLQPSGRDTLVIYPSSDLRSLVSSHSSISSPLLVFWYVTGAKPSFSILISDPSSSVNIWVPSACWQYRLPLSYWIKTTLSALTFVTMPVFGSV